jgi:hypothetical protein
MFDSSAVFFAQVTNAAISSAAAGPDAATPAQQPWWVTYAFFRFSWP